MEQTMTSSQLHIVLANSRLGGMLIHGLFKESVGGFELQTRLTAAELLIYSGTLKILASDGWELTFTNLQTVIEITSIRAQTRLIKEPHDETQLHHNADITVALHRLSILRQIGAIYG